MQVEPSYAYINTGQDISEGNNIREYRGNSSSRVNGVTLIITAGFMLFSPYIGTQLKPMPINNPTNQIQQARIKSLNNYGAKGQKEDDQLFEPLTVSEYPSNSVVYPNFTRSTIPLSVSFYDHPNNMLYSNILIDNKTVEEEVTSMPKIQNGIIYGMLSAVGILVGLISLLSIFVVPLFDVNIAYVLIPATIVFLMMIGADYITRGRSNA